MDSVNDPTRRLDPAAIERLLDLLADPSTTVEEAERIMARFDGHEVEAVLPVFRRLHDAADQPTLHAAARILSRWNGRPIARALIPALEALLGEPGVADLNKLAAAGVLETLGEPVDYPALLQRLEDLGGVARASLDAALAVADHPVALVNFVDQLGRMPRAQVLAVVDDIPARRAAAARPILAALTHSADGDIAVSAIAAIDRLGLRAASGALVRVVANHADPLLREQAGQTLARLGAGTATAPPMNGKPAVPAPATVPIPPAAPASPVGGAAYLSAPSADGGQLLLLAIPSHAGHGWLDVLTVYVTAADGVREHGTVEGVAPVRFEAMREECAAGGVPLEAAAWPVVLAALEAGVVAALRAGGLLLVGPVAWLAAMEAPP
jgi:hypothetical protein